MNPNAITFMLETVEHYKRVEFGLSLLVVTVAILACVELVNALLLARAAKGRKR